MKKKRERSEKKNQAHKGKKKEIEFNFFALRNGLSQNLIKNLMDFFIKARPMFNQSKEELILLNKHFDTLEYAFKALFKKECFDFNKERIENEMLSNDILNYQPKEQNNSNEFVINEKYLTTLFDNDNENDKEKADDIKDNGDNNNKLLSSSSFEDDRFENKEIKDKSRVINQRRLKPKPRPVQFDKKQQKGNIDIDMDININNDNFFDKDSPDSFNNRREEKDNNKNISNNKNNLIDQTHSKDFNQQLFDYKAFSNSQSNKTATETKDQKKHDNQSSISSWINK